MFSKLKMVLQLHLQTGDLGCREYPLLAPYCPGWVPCLAGTFC
jgi:hypothetical protein